MRTYKLTLAYDGTNYVGWQRQTNGLSVQQLVEEAFAPLVGGVAPTVAGASRTDAGAHALGQVASVNADIDLSPIAVCRALNVRLPTDIRVTAVEEAALGFHARFRSVAKSYRYRIVTAPVVHVAAPLVTAQRMYSPHATGELTVVRTEVTAVTPAAADPMATLPLCRGGLGINASRIRRPNLDLVREREMKLGRSGLDKRASRGESGILGEGIRQALLRDKTYGPAQRAACGLVS